MQFDQNKVDEATLALLWLVMEKEKYGTRAWKGFDWETMNRLHEKGYIADPKSKAKSVVVTEEGANLAKELFEKLFSK
ncbi:MAG: hypothetical protein HC846_13930 [Blastocatellia bacterium]|nr:hypothetical protein [Blastocatellia bacterium]